MIAPLLAATVLLQVTAEPSVCPQARVTWHCPGEDASLVEVALGEPVSLETGCPRGEFTVFCPGHLEAHVPFRAGAGLHAVELALAAELALAGGGDGAGTRLVWRAAGRADLQTLEPEPRPRQIQIVPGEGCLAVFPPGRAAWVEPRTVNAGERVVVEPGTGPPGIMVVGEALEAERQPAVVSLTLARESSKQDDPEDAGDGCDDLLADLGVTRSSTDSQGFYRLGPVSPGPWLLQATGPGFHPRERRIVLASQPAEVRLPPVLVERISGLEVTLDPSATGEEPPFRLALYRELMDEPLLRDRWRFEREVVIEDELTVLIENLAPGRYRLDLRKEGTDLRSLHHASVPPGTIHLVVLRPAPLTVFGEITEQQQPVPGAKVVLMAMGMNIEEEADAQGRYEIRAWHPGNYLLSVSPPGQIHFHAEPLDLREHAPGDRIRRDIAIPAGTIAGVVRRREDGHPLADVQVVAIVIREQDEMQASLLATTDAAGHFEIPSQIPGASAHVIARADGYLPAQSPTFVIPDGRTELVLELERATGISGVVTGPAGEPVAGATVSCCPWDPLGKTMESTTTGADGRYSLAGPEGSMVWAAARDYSMAWAPALDNRADLTLQPLQNPVFLILVDGTGTPVRGKPIAVATAEGTLLPFGLLNSTSILNRGILVSNAQGQVLVVGLPPGSYQFGLAEGTRFTLLGLATSPGTGAPITLTLP